MVGFITMLTLCWGVFGGTPTRLSLGGGRILVGQKFKFIEFLTGHYILGVLRMGGGYFSFPPPHT